MNISVADLSNLLWGARAEGLRNGQINAQFAQGGAIQTNESEPETGDTDVYPDEEAFAVYSDGFDDGYSEAIADVKESLTF